MKIKWTIQISTLIAVIAFSAGCSGKQENPDTQLRPVRYTEVGYRGGNELRSLSGTARTDKIINLSFRANGIITQFDMKLGMKVKKGQLLASLDNVQARLAYEQAVTQLNSAASQMNTAKLSLERVRKLYEKGSSSLSDFETAKNSYRTAQESYQSAKRGVSIQQEQIRYGYLYAPADGVIASVAAEKEENVSAGQIVGSMNAGETMEIALGVPESMINVVKTGMAVKINFSALPGKEFQGVVSEVSPSVDSNSATYPIRVSITNPSDEIRSGMAANVTFDFSQQHPTEPQLVVPAVSVGEDANGNFVFLIEGEGKSATVKKQPVEVGSLTGEGFVIKSGLKAGQKVATAGLQTLLDGQHVNLQQ